MALILIDTLRPDYLGFYDHEKETAKFMAKLAKDSAVFTQAFSTSSWTAPSTASMFTSLYPHQHGILEGFVANKRRVERLEQTGKSELRLNRLSGQIATLPEVFKAMGYSTFGMGTNMNIGPEIGFSRGFDWFHREAHAPAKEVYGRLKSWRNEIEQAAPFFLYLHLNDAHGPYKKHWPYYKKKDEFKADARARYISEIGYVDHCIGKIYELLNLDDNTIFMVVSDHGEEFWDHGGTGHNATLFRELNQVLMLLHAPFLGITPQRIDANVSLIDVLPTLVDLAGGVPVQGAEGLSLVPAVKSGMPSKEFAERLHSRILFANRIVDAISSPGWYWLNEETPERQHWAAIHQNWKLVQFLNGSQTALFDHGRDTREINNVLSTHPKVASKLTAALKEFKMHKKMDPAEKVPVNLDEKLLDELRALGYVE